MKEETTTITKEELIKLYARLKADDVAQILNISRSLLFKLLKKNGIALKKPVGRPIKLKVIEK